MDSSRKDYLRLALDVDRLLRLFQVKTRPKAKTFDHAQIGPFGGMILMTILDTEPIPIQALASHLARDKAQITRAVQILEQKSLVQRHRSVEDGRVSLVSLTDEGRGLVEGFQNILADVVKDLFDGLTDAERRDFSASLTKVLCAFAPDEVRQRKKP